MNTYSVSLVYARYYSGRTATKITVDEIHAPNKDQALGHAIRMRGRHVDGFDLTLHYVREITRVSELERTLSFVRDQRRNTSTENDFLRRSRRSLQGHVNRLKRELKEAKS